MRNARRSAAVAYALILTPALPAQETGLVVPVPPLSAVTTTDATFHAPDRSSRGFEITRPIGASSALPLVIFVNAGGPELRLARGYREWARLVTTRGMASVLYDGPVTDAFPSIDEHLRTSLAYLDSLVAALQRGAESFGIDPSTIVIWAGSSQTRAGTPFALDRDRPLRVAGYVLFYGSGELTQPRSDVPVFVARAGLDSPSLNAVLDSLTSRLMRAGAPVTIVTYPAGSHAFDLVDSTAMSARVIDQALDFMATAADRQLQSAIAAGVPDAEAAAAFAAEHWSEAERRYGALARSRPASRSAAWRLGLSQLANGHPAPALESFDRAKSLGQGGARDIGLPASRAALRAGNRARALEWMRWALSAYPRIRLEVDHDAELRPLLQEMRK